MRCLGNSQERDQENHEQRKQVAMLQEEARKTNASLREACERVSLRQAPTPDQQPLAVCRRLSPIPDCRLSICIVFAYSLRAHQPVARTHTPTAAASHIPPMPENMLLIKILARFVHTALSPCVHGGCSG